MILKLPIFVVNSNVQAKIDNELEYKMEECDINIMTFYEINAHIGYTEDGKHYTDIYSNGMRFTSPLPEYDVEKRIKQARIIVQ